MRRVDFEHYENLINKAAQHANKLLKKPDQCRALYACAQLFWSDDETRRDEKKVLACLQKSLKIANTCIGVATQLFVEILNRYLYFYDRRVPSIVVKDIRSLLKLIEDHQPGTDDAAQRLFANTLAHLKYKHSLRDERYIAILDGADD